MSQGACEALQEVPLQERLAILRLFFFPPLEITADEDAHFSVEFLDGELPHLRGQNSQLQDRRQRNHPVSVIPPPLLGELIGVPSPLDDQPLGDKEDGEA